MMRRGGGLGYNYLPLEKGVVVVVFGSVIHHFSNSGGGGRGEEEAREEGGPSWYKEGMSCCKGVGFGSDDGDNGGNGCGNIGDGGIHNLLDGFGGKMCRRHELKGIS
eukprot:TRINITY_DN2408_c1_g1_i1.p1 TRINITY_DN2408_c1_g1~~TRINITY_DN2408_c1_g1_i1.p1  ORF type:complete len:107 (-),score=35.58 TRINITY_DN2408_c1_g1_i1:351-671(-)